MFQRRKKLQSIANEEKKNVGSTSHRTFGTCKFYPRIVFCLLQTIKISLQLSISPFQICSLIIQNNSSRLFHTISFLQLLFILLKFYFPLSTQNMWSKYA
jgi:hypothetical protein